MKNLALLFVAFASFSQTSFAAEGEAEFVFTRAVQLNPNEALSQRDVATSIYNEGYSKSCKFTISSPAVSSPSFKAGRKVILKAGNTNYEFSILDPDNRKKLGEVSCSATGNDGPLSLLKSVVGVQPTPDGLRKVDISYVQREGVEPQTAVKKEEAIIWKNDVPVEKTQDEGISI